MFRADLFTSLSTRFEETSKEESELAKEIISRYSCVSDISNCLIWRVKNGGINSTNYKICGSDSSSFILKSLDAKEMDNDIDGQIVVSDLLQARGVVLPTIYSNRLREKITIAGNRVWLLSEFKSGQYYCGLGNQINNTGAAIGKLFAELASIDSTGLISKTPVYTVSGFLQSANRLQDNMENLKEFFSARDCQLLQGYKETIKCAIDELVSCLAYINELPLTTSHIDLHPHNILVDGSCVSALLDIESLRVSNQHVAIAFCIYKLIRQGCYHKGYTSGDYGKVARDARALLWAIVSEGGIREIDIEMYRLLALFEVFRRIFIITDSAIIERSQRWSHVLRFHLSGIEEMQVIFRA